MTEAGGLFDRSAPIINDSLTDHHCFGCGDRNPIGLQLRFREMTNGEGVWAEFTPTREHEGYLGMVHGGILSTMLDEAMSWAITAAGAIGVTGRMETAFRQPASIGHRLVVTGKVECMKRRVIEVSGEIRAADQDHQVATANARFIRVSEGQARAWREAYRADGESAFGRAARQEN